MILRGNGKIEKIVNNGWTYKDHVDQAAAGLSVLDYYTQHYSHSSREKWQNRITAGEIRLNGATTTAETQLKQGQQLTYHRAPWQEPEVPLGFAVLYEDSDLLVVSKPSGLPVLPGGGFLQHTLLWQLEQRYPDSKPRPIHRLGRGTSGLLLLARSSTARAVLSQQMRDRQIRKTYRALATGSSMADIFTITQPIGKVSHPVLGYLYAATKDGLFAHSECRVLKRHTQTALVEVTISTGRPHQIRIHLAAAGYPLLGDPLYGPGGVPLPVSSTAPGKIPVPGDCGYHLHALHLTFAHPSDGRTMSVSCPAPPELDFWH